MNEDRIRALIEQSSNIAGAVTSTALSLLGPVGAFAGAFGAPVLSSFMQKIGTDILDRNLSTREKERTGAVFSYITIRISELIREGKSIRTDGFFNNGINGNSNADEILEGLLLAAQKEHEEKKLIYYSNLMADCAFDPFISKSLANNMLKIVQELSYTQLCLLKIFNSTADYHLRNIDYSEFSGGNISFDLLNMLHEINDMIRLNLVSRKGIIVLQLQNILPAEIQSFGMGTVICQKMLLKKIPEEDTNSIIHILQ